MAALIPYRSENRLLDRIRDEMDTMFERFLGGGSEERGGNGELATWAPRVDISETEKAFVVKADLPGVDPKEVEVSVRDGVLTVRGERREQKEEKHKNYHRTERFVGQFFRSIPLPSGVDADKIEAASNKGVLTITVPKKPEAQPKKISVKGE